MATLIEHLLKLTDHRDRDLLELTLSKALIDVLPVQRIVIAHVVAANGVKRWLDVARLDAHGGGRFLDPQRVDLQTLAPLDEHPGRSQCLSERDVVEMVLYGELGPRLYLLPLFSETRPEDEGVIEVHSSGPLNAAALLVIDQLRRVYRNMYVLLEHSGRDALTGLLNRHSLDAAFYSAVLEEMDGAPITGRIASDSLPMQAEERRHHVPANYWLGSVQVDEMSEIRLNHGHSVAEQTTKLVGRVLSNTFRTYDRLYRFDGAHFGVLLHCPDEALTLSAFERARLNVEKFNFPQVGRVTISCSITPVQLDDSPDSALEKTGQALHWAQCHGGNQCLSHLRWLSLGEQAGTTLAGTASPLASH